MKPVNKLILTFFFALISVSLVAQNILFNETDTLKYFAAISEPDTNWYLPHFDDSDWNSGVAVVGFGYGAEGYSIVNSETKSLYTRLTFHIDNKSEVKSINFTADFDDGYIAYLNGIEISRVNIDKSIQYPPYDAIATRSHASELAVGITSPVLGIYLDSILLSNCLVDGENILAVHIVNDSIGDDLLYIPIVFDLSPITYKSYRYTDFSSRYKRLIDLDSTDLPIINIETDQFGIAYDQRIWTTAHMGIVNNRVGKFNRLTDNFLDYNGPISIRSRGQSSRDFAKKSYRIELIDEESNDTSVSLLGMPDESDWVLFGPYTDKSQVRNKFAYDLASRMGRYNPRTRFCELVLNGQTEGLYILTENIKRDNNRVDIAKLKDTDISGDELTGGYIFKFDKSDVFPKGAYRTNQRELVYPEVPTEEQKKYLKQFFTTYDSILTKTNAFNDPDIGFRKYASDSSLVDFIIINELTKNPDAYIFSTYMYKDRDDKDGRIMFGPLWDCDIAFGNSQFQEGFKTNGWQFHFNSNNSGMRLTRYFQDTEFVKLFRNRWFELRESTFCNDSIFGYFDVLVDQVKIASKRNYEIWPVIDKNLFYQAYYVDSYENEISQLKNWLAQRLSWIDNNIDDIYYELKVVGNEPWELYPNIGMRTFPNPFENELSIDFNLENAGVIRLDIYNLTGQLQSSYKLGELAGYCKFVLNDNQITDLQKGMYVAKLFVNNISVQSVKIIKQ